jgi:hypothetical protein
VHGLAFDTTATILNALRQAAFFSAFHPVGRLYRIAVTGAMRSESPEIDRRENDRPICAPGLLPTFAGHPDAEMNFVKSSHLLHDWR